MRKTIFSLLFSIVISIPLLLPYFHSGYFPTHDGEWAVVRLADMYRTVKDLQIPARYSGYLNAGYGYPLFNFAYPFPYYLGLLPLSVGFGFVSSIKLLFALSVPLSAFGMFLFSQKLWKSTVAGAVSAVLYTYAPYRLVDLFVRGSLGESLSFVLFPFILLGMLSIASKPLSIKTIGITSILLSFLIGTHNSMTILFLPVLFVFSFSLYHMQGKKMLPSLLLSMTLGILLSTFFWLPALFEKNLILLSQTAIADRSLYFIKPLQLITPSWGYESPTGTNGFTYQIGLPQIITALLTLGLVAWSFVKKSKKGTTSLYTYTGSILLVMYIFFLFQPSQLLWENIPLLSEINYPWIMLSQIILLVSIVAGYSVKEIKYGKIIGVLLAILAIVLFIPYARPQSYVDRGDDFYVSNDAVTTSSDELMPLWVRKKPGNRPTSKVEIIGEGEINLLTANSKSVNFTADIKEKSIVRINTTYYPGWEVKVDSVSTPFSYKNEYGVMDVQVPKGRHSIQANFKETALRLTSNIVSGITFICMLLFLFSSKIQKWIQAKLYGHAS